MVEEDLVASYTVGPTQPPSFQNVDYWERSGDPFHADAFKGTELAGFGSKGARRMGWMAIDWCENPVGFVPDGSLFQGEAPKFTLIEAPNPALPSGHTIAVRKYDDWLSAAIFVKHDGVYTEIKPTFEALWEESQRDDVLFLLVSRERWEELIGCIEPMLRTDGAVRMDDGVAGVLNGKVVFTDAFDMASNRKILEGRQFSVRKRTERLVPDTSVYPLLHGVAVYKR
ncbi:hypothetical protein O152_gp254 [Pseudomonas phage PaBG]|uniref:Uncharacterized protein n=1 Tax=Pseudomonas phage PaBG TaxID=1335230 RepID=S5WKL2_9CAUD|nr:hypothetical protein O152_gp254 [Pseudomonas phage PaBG]AGS82106.1 hypothetical protein PaBG_00232 [Pseudomonas phage PaBG]